MIKCAVRKLDYSIIIFHSLPSDVPLFPHSSPLHSSLAASPLWSPNLVASASGNPRKLDRIVLRCRRLWPRNGGLYTVVGGPWWIFGLKSARHVRFDQESKVGGRGCGLWLWGLPAVYLENNRRPGACFLLESARTQPWIGTSLFYLFILFLQCLGLQLKHESFSCDIARFSFLSYIWAPQV
jgi:hypothetical protein